MHFPRSWVKAEGECEAPDRRKLKFSVWGWGGDDVTAKREAASRLQRLLERVRRGDPIPQKYEYGRGPLREEILQTLGDGAGEEAGAVLTRNRYGAVVLNTARLLFLDIDVPAEGMFQRFGRMLAKREEPTEAALTKLRAALRNHGRGTFRIYRTAAGLRAIAVDREYDPTGRDTQDLMKRTGTDAAFMKLCLAQRSFRARLTPKPWRCAVSLPPGQYPHLDERARGRHAEWVARYEAACKSYATCQFLEIVGNSSPRGEGEKLVGLHDRLTRSGESLPLA
jgi:hypothetical protein